MAGKKKAAPVAAQATSKTIKTVKRSRVRSLDRRTLSKSAKRMLVGASREVFRTELAAETEAKRKTSGTAA